MSDDIPICEDECVTWGGHADNCRVPAAIRALEAKVREAESEHAGVVATLGKALRELGFAAQTTGGTAGRDEGLVAAIDGATQALSLIGVSRSIDLVSDLRADRDRLAGEVRMLEAVADSFRKSAKELAARTLKLDAEVARLTSELAQAKINAGNFAVIDASQPISDAVPTYEAMAAELAAARENEARWLWMFPDSPMVSVTERMQRVYRKWDGSDSWNAAVDAARRAGGEG